MPTLRRKPRLKKRQRLWCNQRIDLWCVDECHFQQHGSRIRMWVPPEEHDPVQLLAPTRKAVAVCGAVQLRTGRFVNMRAETFNAKTFGRFLTMLMRHRTRGRRMIIILDNAKYHHASLLRPLLQRHRKHLTLLFLPAYSPELNPIERVWKLVRRLCTHNRYFAHVEELVEAVTVQLRRWSKPNAQLRRLCCII